MRDENSQIRFDLGDGQKIKRLGGVVLLVWLFAMSFSLALVAGFIYVAILSRSGGNMYWIGWHQPTEDHRPSYRR